MDARRRPPGLHRLPGRPGPVVRAASRARGRERIGRARGEHSRVLPAAGRDAPLRTARERPGRGRRGDRRGALVIGTAPPGARPISEVLEQARSRLDRLEPAQAWAAMQDGALLVDIRPQAQRAAEGQVPGALVIERNVLEWRLDPASDARLPVAGSYDLRVIVMCSAGYTSSLAAASLQDLGLSAATDLAGGVPAWARAGLPVGP